jgi:Glycosyl transferases group 1
VFLFPNSKALKRGPRICIVTGHDTNFDPMISCAGELANSLHTAGYEMHLFVSGHPGVSQEIAPHSLDGPVVWRVPSDPFQLRSALSFFHQHLSFDLFHAFSASSAAACLPLANTSGKPIVLNFGDFDGSSDWSPSFRDVLASATWIIFDSASSLHKAHRLADIASKASVIARGLPASALERWRLTPPVRGTVGALKPPVGNYELLQLTEAYLEIDERLRRSLLLVRTRASSLPAANEHASRVDRILQSKQASIIDAVHPSPLSSHFSQMHVFVAAAQHPDLWHCLLQAATAGVPIVAAVAKGVPEFFTQPETCLSVPPDNPRALARAVESVLRDDTLAGTLSRGARTMLESLNSEKNHTQYSQIYAHLLDTSFMIRNY